MRAGLVTFDFPSQYRRADVVSKPTAIGTPLIHRLASRGVEVLAAHASLPVHRCDDDDRLRTLLRDLRREAGEGV